MHIGRPTYLPPQPHPVNLPLSQRPLVVRGRQCSWASTYQDCSASSGARAPDPRARAWYPGRLSKRTGRKSADRRCGWELYVRRGVNATPQWNRTYVPVPRRPSDYDRAASCPWDRPAPTRQVTCSTLAGGQKCCPSRQRYVARALRASAEAKAIASYVSGKA